jgi:hypothetical protein
MKIKEKQDNGIEWVCFVIEERCKKKIKWTSSWVKSNTSKSIDPTQVGLAEYRRKVFNKVSAYHDYFSDNSKTDHRRQVEQFVLDCQVTP